MYNCIQRFGAIVSGLRCRTACEQYNADAVGGPQSRGGSTQVSARPCGALQPALYHPLTAGRQPGVVRLRRRRHGHASFMSAADAAARCRVCHMARAVIDCRPVSVVHVMMPNVQMQRVIQDFSLRAKTEEPNAKRRVGFLGMRRKTPPTS